MLFSRKLGQAALHRVAVEADDRLEHLGAQDRPPELLLLGDHLQQDVAGDVVAGLVLDDPDLLALDDQAADVVERDVPALRRVVQATVRVLLDQAFLAHGPQCTSGFLRRKKELPRPAVPDRARHAGPGGSRPSTWHGTPATDGGTMSQQQVLERLQAQVGQEIHCSDWLEITQQRIDAFADATGDHQWIHVDPERAARESPWKATDRARLPDPVAVPAAARPRGRRPPGLPGRPAGRSTTASTSCASRTRCESAAASARAACCSKVEPVTGGLQVTEQYTVEIEGQAEAGVRGRGDHAAVFLAADHGDSLIPPRHEPPRPGSAIVAAMHRTAGPGGSDDLRQHPAHHRPHAGRARQPHRARARHDVREVRVLQSAVVGEGPPRDRDHRGRRAQRRAQARPDRRRGDLGQHRHRARDGLRRQGLSVRRGRWSRRSRSSGARSCACSARR